MKCQLCIPLLLCSLQEEEIQVDEHCSVEDAKAALDLYKLVEDEWEGELMAKESQKTNQPQKTKLDTSVQDSYLNDEFWPDEL